MRAEQVEEGARAAALGEREALRELVQRQRETDRALVELLLALEERGAHLRLLQLPPDRLRQLDRLPRAVERLGGVPLRRLELREPRMQGGEEPHLVGPPRAGDRLLVQSDGARLVPPRGDVSEQRARLDLEIGRADRPRVGEGVGGGSSGVVHPPGPEVDRGEVDLRGGELALQAHAALRMPRRRAVPHPALRHPHRVLCVAHGGVMVAAAAASKASEPLMLLTVPMCGWPSEATCATASAARSSRSASPGRPIWASARPANRRARATKVPVNGQSRALSPAATAVSASRRTVTGRTSLGRRWANLRANRSVAARRSARSRCSSSGRAANSRVRVPPPAWRNGAWTTTQRRPVSRTANDRSRS